ncbi:GlxA family transcriptional regulator [Archangium gephyra]|uniref:GlxA family transcriptional regulator n=1 Tax=Archangium gephyra TaxID=48 RepID=UPI0035D433FA
MKIAVLAFPGVQLLDIIGPLDVFAEACRQLGAPHVYEPCVIGVGPGPIVGSSGLQLLPDTTIADSDESLDTLLVAGGHELEPLMAPAVLEWLRRRVSTTRRYGSVCSGVFALAQAGLLEGRRVTTHWRMAKRLAVGFPSLTVDVDRLYVRDGPVCSSAGVTAGMDLALALVEEDHGREVARQVARQLVMFLKRPGGQSQFSANLTAQVGECSAIQQVQAWVLGNLAEELSIPRLARRAAMSPRNFARVFRRETGSTPADFVEAARLDAARRLLEETGSPLKQIAAECGFGDVNGLRRAFLRQLAVTPAEYRRRFQSEPRAA